jgi:hypothetical protein
LTADPISAPSYRNRPIIRVECNITMYIVSASSLASEELAVIEWAASIMLRVPLDRVLSTRWTVVGTTTAHRGRLLTIAEASDKPPSTGLDDERIESPETLWDVEATWTRRPASPSTAASSTTRCPTAPFFAAPVDRFFHWTAIAVSHVPVPQNPHCKET